MRPLSPNISKQNFVANDLLKVIAILAILFGVGTLVPLAEKLHANRYQNLDIAKALKEHETQISKRRVGSPGN